MNSEERVLAFEEWRSEKHENIDKIYQKTENDSISPENAWKNVYMAGRYGKINKYVNEFKCFDYNIYQRVENDKAEVIMQSKLAFEIKIILTNLISHSVPSSKS